MKKKVLCTALAAPWQMRRNQLIFDSKIEFLKNVTLAHNGDYKPISVGQRKTEQSSPLLRRGADNRT